MHLTLTPAYGRDYKSKKAILEDYFADKDFLLQPDGAPINRAQIIATFPDRDVNVRYRAMRSVCVIKPTAEVPDEVPAKPKRPSIATLERWSRDGVAQATDGCEVECDGYCEHGKLSWLIKLGYL